MGQISKKLRRLVDGYGFWCPGCEEVHVISDCWQFDGNVDSPTFSPSLLVTYDGRDRDQPGRPPAVCHSFIRAGRIEFLPDCTHRLKGQTVDFPDLPVHLTDGSFSWGGDA